MEVQVSGSIKIDDSIHVKKLLLIGKTDDECDALDQLKTLFESKDSDLSVTIRVVDGILAFAETDGRNIG